MRYAIAGLVVLVAALVWWGTRDRPAARATPARHGTVIADWIPESDPPAAPEAGDGGLLFVGRVVSARKPAAGATVTVDIQGQGRWEARTDADGTYSVRAVRKPDRSYQSVHVEARLQELGAATDFEMTPRSTGRIRVRTLVLGPVHSLAVLVTHRGQPVPGARVVTGEPATPGGVASTDTSGRVELRLPAGEHAIRAACDGYGRAETKARVPETSAVTIELPRQRTVTVTVADKATGRPIVGATLDLYEQRPGDSLQRFSPPVDPLPTDERGVTVLRELADDTVVRATASAPGYPPPSGDLGTTTIRARATESRIELDPPRTIRWPVVAGELPVPPEGARIAIHPWSSSSLRAVPPGGVMEQGHLVVDGWGPRAAHGIAEEPGGGLAYLQAQAGQEVGGEIAFRRPRRVDVLAHEPSGVPVDGAAFVLRGPGGNPMAPIGLTDAEGKLSFTGLHGGRADLHLVPNPAYEWVAPRAGTVDLDSGDGLVDVVLQPAVELVVRVRVEGEPGLPAGYELYADTAPVVAEEDHERGVLRARVRPLGETIQVALGAPGFAPVRTETRTGEVEIDLRSGATLTLEVIRPPDGQSAVALETWREDWKAWTEWFAREPDRQGSVRLPPGRYRALDRPTGVTSDEVRLENGSTARLVLDLSRTGLVRGRVEMPEGVDPNHVRVRVAGIEVHGVERNLVGVAPDGTFRLSVPGDRNVTLQASHPLLRPANEVSLTQPRDGVILRLEPGPTATVELDRAPSGDIPEVPVLLYRGEPEGEPVARLRAAVVGPVLAFGGFAPGTYNVWIDARPFAPVTLRGIALVDGTNDLGRAATSDGSSLRVKLVVPAGQSAPRIGLFAWRVGEPSYTRGLNSGGEAEVVLVGLGPGTFRVSATAVAGTRKPLEREVTLDGVESREILFDPR